MNSKVILGFAAFAVVIVTIQAAAFNKREAVEERPEAPLLQDCEGADEKREDCFLTDGPNLENWRIYLQEVEDWEKKYPEAAAEFEAKNPTTKKQEQEKLEELRKFAALHDGQE